MNQYLNYTHETDRLGFSSNSPQYIPLEYLEKQFFIIFRTCHSYGDWVILSAMPKLLKQKYPNSTVVIPSPDCLSKYFSPSNWKAKHENPFNNVIEVFSNNPHIDGMIDEIPAGLDVYHDHFRIYDLNNLDVNLTEQMLKFWRFNENEMIDSAPDLYWSEEEIKEGDEHIKRTFGNEPFGFLYIDDSFFETVDEIKWKDVVLPLIEKRKLIQKKINEVDNLPWMYYAGKDIKDSAYNTKSKSIDVRNFKTTLRVQNYIKSKSKLIIGHQGGYGTDCMSRYTTCYVMPLSKDMNEHFIRTTKYLKYE